MNRTKIQYAIIAHQHLTEAQENVSRWTGYLDQRLDNLDQEEAEEYNRRVGALINHLANNGPSPHS